MDLVKSALLKNQKTEQA